MDQCLSFQRQTVSVCGNGRTGQVIGEYPKSKAKIVMLIVAIIVIVAKLAMIF